MIYVSQMIQTIHYVIYVSQMIRTIHYVIYVSQIQICDIFFVFL